jgi:LemA protein
METVLWVLTGILGAVVVAAIWLFLAVKNTHNILVALDQRCDTAMSDVDVHLKHRYNLIPGLVEVVKDVTGYEERMVIGVIEARTDALKATNVEIRLEAERNLTAQVSNLLANIESFPELKALPEFTQLRHQLVDCENRITAARRFHNLAVEEYNTALRQFPGSWVAAKRRMSSRRQFDLGVERVLIDEPVAIAF